MKAFRNILLLLLIAAMIFTLAACGGQSAGGAGKEPASAEKTEDAPSEQPTAEAEAPATESAPAEEPESAAPSHPAAEAQGPSTGLFWLAGDEFFDDQDVMFRYDLNASLLPSFMTGDTDSDEDYFAFSEEYSSARSNIYYYTSVNGILLDGSDEERASEQLQTYSDNLQSREYMVSEIGTFSGSGYTIYIVRGERVSDEEVILDSKAIVCFDGERFSLDVDFHSNAYLHALDPGDQEDGYDPDFDPAQYVNNTEDQFLTFLGSLSFEKSEVK